MERKIIIKIGGWEIILNRNIHMYSHTLSVKKGKHKISIPCEDLATEEKVIGVWLYAVEEPDVLKKELEQVLLQWANRFEEVFEIYTSKENFITSNKKA